MEHRRTRVVVAVAAVLVAAALVWAYASMARDGRAEWRVAADPQATPDDIIDAGHPVDVAINDDQMVVTWEVRPEDDEGPHRGAWRLYDRDKGEVADGDFGAVDEASGRIDVMAVRGGFLLEDYKKQGLHHLDPRGRLTSAYLPEAKPGTSLAGGVLLRSESPGPMTWHVVLPARRSILPLTGLPTKNPQGIALTAEGTVWVLLPRKDGGAPDRVAHAANGRGPWTAETIPLPKGSGTSWSGFSGSRDRLFVVGTHAEGDREPVDVILAREAGERASWKRINASGIGKNLTAAPTITELPTRRLVVTGETGSWIQRPNGSGFDSLRPPRSAKHSTTTVLAGGRWLWASESRSGNSLHYSADQGATWSTFQR